MKKQFLLLFILGISIVFTNCSKDEEEDLTAEITGEYMGSFGSNTSGTINPYEIIVSKINNNRVAVRPKSGSEFDEFEIEIERSNSTTINSPTDDNQQLDKSIIFSIGVSAGMTLSIDPTGDAQAFVGELQ